MLAFSYQFITTLQTIRQFMPWTFSFKVSSMGITPFFVENVSELQLCAIKLVTAVSVSFSFLSLYAVDYITVLLEFSVSSDFCGCIMYTWVFTVQQNQTYRLSTLLFPVFRCSPDTRSIVNWSWRRSLRLWPDCQQANVLSGISGVAIIWNYTEV